jgi:hypothetical protein
MVSPEKVGISRRGVFVLEAVASDEWRVARKSPQKYP